MENNELVNININYSPCILKTCSFGNIINSNEIEIFVSGKNKAKTKSFLHYLTFSTKVGPTLILEPQCLGEIRWNTL